MKARNTTIRLATPQDLPALYPIYDQARRYMVAMDNANQWGFYYPEPAVTQADVAAGRCYVVVDTDDGTLLGVFVYFEGDYPPYATIRYGQWLNDAPYGVLQRIASAGLGGGFADIVLRWLTSKGKDIRVDTHRDNVNMRNALIRYGFRLCGSVTLENGEQRIAFQWRKPIPAKTSLTPEEQAKILQAAAELVASKNTKTKRDNIANTAEPHATAPTKPVDAATNASTPPNATSQAPKGMRIARAIRRPKP